MSNSKTFFKKDHMVKRILMSIFGVLICGVAVGFFKRAMFGVDPFQSLMAGLDCVIPISFGTLYVIVNVIMLLFSLIFDRHYIGLATFINLFLIGYIAEFSLKMLESFFPALGIPGRSICLIIGILIICVASSFYMTADIGVSTYDAVALIISNTWHIGKFKYVRIVTDVVCVILGVASSALFLASHSTSSQEHPFQVSVRSSEQAPSSRHSSWDRSWISLPGN